MGRQEVRVELNNDALAAITQPMIEQLVHEIAARAGSGYQPSVMKTDRPHGRVSTAGRKARRQNAKHNTLLKALQGGG